MSQGKTETTVIVTGLLVFVAVSLWFIARGLPQKEHFPPLSTYSPRPNGALALYELLQKSDIPAARWLQDEYHYPAGGTVVVANESTPSPSELLLGRLDAKALHVWLRAGGHLVLVDTPRSFLLADIVEELQPDAKPGGHKRRLKAAQAELGLPADWQPPLLKYDASQQGTTGHFAPAREVRTGEVYRLATAPPSLWRGITSLEIATPEYGAPELGVPLLRADNPDEAVVSWLPVGDGEVLWIGLPELACNNWLARADNHRLLLSAIGYAAHGGTVYFDEHLHGYREQTPDTFGLLTHTRGGLLLLALLGLIALSFAGAAIIPARYLPLPAPARRQAQEMVLAQASLYERAGLRRPVALHLLDGLRQAIRQHEHLATAPDDPRLIAWLRQAGARGLPVDQLLFDVLEDRVAVGSPRQLLQLAHACDRLHAALA